MGHVLHARARRRPEHARSKHVDGGRENGYLWIGGDMLKRTADWLEKMSVAARPLASFRGSP